MQSPVVTRSQILCRSREKHMERQCKIRVLNYYYIFDHTGIIFRHLNIVSQTPTNTLIRDNQGNKQTYIPS